MATRFRSDLELFRQEGANPVEGTTLLRAPVQAWEIAEAEVLAEKETRSAECRDLFLIAELTSVDSRVIHQVYSQYLSLDRAAVGPFCALHVTGPREGGALKLPNDAPEQWALVREFFLSSIDLVAGSAGRPRLHVFWQGPASLALAVGAKLARFWSLQIYNLAKDLPAPPYRQVLIHRP